jgi:hypothetical protein
MIQRLALVALPFLLLAACGPVEKKADAAGTAPPPAEPGKSGSVAVMVKPYVEGPLTVGVEGVGPITAATAFDLPTFKVLFPRAVVAQAFLHVGTGRPQPIINVEQNQTPLMEVSKGEDGDLGSIRLEGGDVRGPKDETLLTQWSALGLDIANCRAGEGRDLNTVICARPEAPNVAYLIGVPGWTRGGLPPVETLNAKGQLNGFVWRPAEVAAVGAA